MLITEINPKALPQAVGAKPREEILQLLRGYRLTTAEIIYHLPDYPHLLQSYLWQDYDLAPEFPILNNFIDFWQRELDGPLHSIQLCQRDGIKTLELHITKQEWLH